MLSRTADSLYWLGRYIERAENLARILEVADRMALTPNSGGARQDEWHSAVVISGCQEGFYKTHERATPATVVDYIARSPDNPTSIRSCLQRARTNGRAVRAALTRPMWETLNATWLDLDSREGRIAGGDLRDLLEWVKERALLFHGAVVDTMLRDDAHIFLQLGTMLERADNTARLLDVKYHVLLPANEEVGGGLDFYQWAAILRGASALGSYSYLYRDGIKPWQVAELLILRPEMPRSLAGCLGEMVELLGELADLYGRKHECQRLAGEMHSRLRYGRIDTIFSTGLHEYLTAFIQQNNILGLEVSKAYLI
ncbi:alpha-E domain-containing protein [Inquilinus limosus]|mgnify:CR=1 FL=1|uniref:A alpha-helical domain with a conserved ER moti n=1 Tax=Inquilinus limosus MP06 TaxID=1398085 RepID=A0A0A0D9D8_9PROT|nr:alpha-E domain-containing protein [Inquilinus limosus]KGM34670.1 A alpha-helical domain with a conserved ER moti [Inquilinus limosus MP06]